MRSREKLALLCALLPGLVLAEPLVGPSVGNADLLVSEASRLYNQKKHALAAEMFLQATRADPSALPTYLQLARSYLAAKQIRRACYVYRVYLKASADSPDRKKAQSESDLCERQLRTAKKQPPDPSPRYVEARAVFFQALDKKALLGPGSAAQALTSLVTEGFTGPELGEMAAKLRSEVLQQAEALHQRVVAREAVAIEEISQGKELFKLASELGAPPEGREAKSAFLEGVAALIRREHIAADALFAEAAKAEAVPEYRFFRAMALYRNGDRAGALKSMETELPEDPRTAVLRASLAVGLSSERGAAELERLLFSRKFPAN